MKKLAYLTIMICFIAVSCARPLIPKVEMPAPAPVPAAAGSAISQEVADGMNVYTTRCNKCHALPNVEKYTGSKWENILASMAPKAKLNDTETSQVKAYVQAYAKK